MRLSIRLSPSLANGDFVVAVGGWLIGSVSRKAHCFEGENEGDGFGSSPTPSGSLVLPPVYDGSR